MKREYIKTMEVEHEIINIIEVWDLEKKKAPHIRLEDVNGNVIENPDLVETIRKRYQDFIDVHGLPFVKFKVSEGDI